jgi:hypothetical protein
LWCHEYYSTLCKNNTLILYWLWMKRCEIHLTLKFSKISRQILLENRVFRERQKKTRKIGRTISSLVNVHLKVNSFAKSAKASLRIWRHHHHHQQQRAFEHTVCLHHHRVVKGRFSPKEIRYRVH